jgi:hypothetical protein
MYFSALLCELWTSLMFAGSEPPAGTPRCNSAAFGALFGLAAAALCVSMRDFAIDDALISVRYARNIASGIGHRFNAGDIVSDGITPLPWAWMLAPLAHADALTVLSRVRFLAAVGCIATFAAVGHAIGRSATFRVRLGALALAAVTAAPPAYAMSGMETWASGGLLTLAALMRHRPLSAAAIVGLAAAFRPEAIGFALVFALVLGFRAERPLSVLGYLLLASLPFIVTSVVRYSVWGTAMPLAAIAKPSSPSLGFHYAVAGVLSSGVLIASAAPFAIARAPRATKALAFAIAAHFLCITIAGGDWMPLFRLWAPVLPLAPLLFVELASTCSKRIMWARFALALLLAVGLGGRAAMVHRSLLPARLAAIAQATPLLRGERVATIDIGWVSAATDGYIFDMAGVTNPPVAALPGGHTSKRVSLAMLRDHDVTRVLLWASAAPVSLERWHDATFPRHAEQRLSHELAQWKASAWVPMGNVGGYVLLEPRSQ